MATLRRRHGDDSTEIPESEENSQASLGLEEAQAEGDSANEETTEKVEEKGNAGLYIGLAIALFVLGAGGVTTMIILKKKKKNLNKEEK